jgi:hypothetical protein
LNVINIYINQKPNLPETRTENNNVITTSESSKVQTDNNGQYLVMKVETEVAVFRKLKTPLVLSPGVIPELPT